MMLILSLALAINVARFRADNQRSASPYRFHHTGPTIAHITHFHCMHACQKVAMCQSNLDQTSYPTVGTESP
jgi:hypothetical protein